MQTEFTQASLRFGVAVCRRQAKPRQFVFQLVARRYSICIHVGGKMTGQSIFGWSNRVNFLSALSTGCAGVSGGTGGGELLLDGAGATGFFPDGTVSEGLAGRIPLSKAKQMRTPISKISERRKIISGSLR